uniref:DUF834 domain-containing protein n=1 Tax=Oryza glumipatula TaxID=40148 RepID=A0A0D9Z063_9ORYZ
MREKNKNKCSLHLPPMEKREEGHGGWGAREFRANLWRGRVGLRIDGGKYHRRLVPTPGTQSKAVWTEVATSGSASEERAATAVE